MKTFEKNKTDWKAAPPYPTYPAGRGPSAGVIADLIPVGGVNAAAARGPGLCDTGRLISKQAPSIKLLTSHAPGSIQASQRMSRRLDPAIASPWRR
jgi:hypothetical protein